MTLLPSAAEVGEAGVLRTWASCSAQVHARAGSAPALPLSTCPRRALEGWDGEHYNPAPGKDAGSGGFPRCPPSPPCVPSQEADPLRSSADYGSFLAPGSPWGYVWLPEVQRLGAGQMLLQGSSQRIRAGPQGGVCQHPPGDCAH